MKPQQILNKLAKYNEVQKVELSAEPMEIELASIDDFNKFDSELKKAESDLKEAQARYSKIEAEMRDVKELFRRTSNLAEGIDQDIRKMQNDVIKAGANIGVDIRDQVYAKTNPMKDLANTILRRAESGIKKL